MNDTRQHGKIHTCHASRRYVIAHSFQSPLQSQNDCRKSAHARKKKGKKAIVSGSHVRSPTQQLVLVLVGALSKQIAARRSQVRLRPDDDSAVRGRVFSSPDSIAPLALLPRQSIQ